QVELTQAYGPISVVPGEAATISCSLHRTEGILAAKPSWYVQKPGGAPQLLIFKSKERAPGVPERISGETYGNIARLTIAEVQVDDEGDYFCAVWHNDVSHCDVGGCKTETKTPHL
uniref:Ig-like domain-containing protein n=1 Tax=Salvator merianae TaxID=96440 RepID=A0A8D0C7U5_SALMN